MTPLLEINKLNVRIPMAEGVLHAVRDVSFNVEQNEIVGIVGESGCGKSMTALAIMGLLSRRAERQAKVLNFRGTDLTSLKPKEMGKLRGDKISMIFQEPMTSLNPVYTIGNQLEEVFLRHLGGSRAGARERAINLLDKVGIPAPELRLRQYPHQLSGGLRQRVMIAMALMCGPELIIADEPTTALDVTIQAQVLSLLKRLQGELEMSVILISHDLGVVARMADRVVVMYAGEVVETGPTEELFRSPCHPYTQGLLKCAPGVKVSAASGSRLGTIPGAVPSLIGPMEGCAFRSRCDYSNQECEQQVKPQKVAVGTTHEYRCVLSPKATLANFREPTE